MNAETRAPQHTDVTVVGAGPVGLGLARLLGLQGHSVVVIERQNAPYPLPRAVVFDDEIGRIFQNMGLAEQVRKISAPVPDHYEWRNRDGRTLLSMDWSGTGNCGWPVESFFAQPELERVLAESLEEMDTVTVLRGTELVSLEDQGDSLTAECIGPNGDFEIEAQFLIGCDGSKSTVREALGIQMKDLGFRYDWLIVDTLPQDDLEWSPQNWQLCDPRRPTTLVSGGVGRRRWEFMRLPGEDPAELNTEERAWELLRGWDRTAENTEIERRALYTFTACWGQTWNRGRAAIAGDAAHQMPPFAGQGMCSGLRDVANLAWKLDLTLTGSAGPAILDTYTSERSLHIRYAIAMSVALGQVICVLDEDQAEDRDQRMLAGGGDPAKVLPLTESPVLGDGITDRAAASASNKGTLAPQFAVADGLLDEVTGPGAVLLTKNHRSDTRPRSFSIEELGDPTGAWTRWFDEIDADAVMIRPDHYIFGVADASRAAALYDRYTAAFTSTMVPTTI
ncbi:bifunctional 3-(3-hydroxy-phenyl)propionate/3-hydroxycinnamic acid hydroxylase [Kocuria sp. TGY1127_2]|uniref:bifunctional 3-(3-hydroxy-phenyl)propionate/3-hydroxycinnamic acid hydroxylase MhpA n=1 Tax=Kocuria sp. TGY1127_2 TaxID=2711328 RepID=UPI0015C0456B|nr:bifunctional 3-(3-hydroxy-phenyl)propionate/3-hydroxycinnamic acid hydroxylase [Kocuria sp. TGY1127_2]